MIRGRQQRDHAGGALGVRQLEVGIYSKCRKTKKKRKILNEAGGKKPVFYRGTNIRINRTSQKPCKEEQNGVKSL